MDVDAPPDPTFAETVALKFQQLLDRTTVYIRFRWCMFVIALTVYLVRVFLVKGFYIVTYALGIYLLNLLLGFLSPAIDPEEQQVLPTSDKEEFRPFDRKLPEFKFWVSAMRVVCLSITATFFQMFDLPVFWPILLAYFILLVALTLKDRVKHMIKYNYLPFSTGKKQTYAELTKMEKPGEKSAGSDK